MSDPGNLPEAGAPAGVEPEDAEVAQRLTDQRPIPPAGFRGALGRHLAARDPGYGPRPARLRLMLAGYTAGGSALIALGALLATGKI